MTVDHPKHPLFAHPGPVARAIVSAIDRGASEVYVPGYWRLIMAVVRNTPEALFQRLSFLVER
jgi:decaprenylphospho-beta-D-erythro-pentofuranosid-2-ulose 2-reductase